MSSMTISVIDSNTSMSSMQMSVVDSKTVKSSIQISVVDIAIISLCHPSGEDSNTIMTIMPLKTVQTIFFLILGGFSLFTLFRVKENKWHILYHFT